ncbi:UDP-4-amino-4,6-dideoxy-N-acetyl-beta-L-altrosamine N-acetyltransferase [Clostridiaceae bacterium M8S5]|nr:UDP-4-amino-4,6-dideoxy-N-acetyl-beta-L-altrosamine N-acetyltransferase [Clostridiaceae bacterium M8S5]
MKTINGYKLVEVNNQYESLILRWRNLEHIRINMYRDTLIEEKEHREWLDKIKNKKNILARLMLYENKPIGFVNFVDIDDKNNKAHWGFYIGDKEAPRGSGTVMGLLALDLIFLEHGLRKLCSEVLGFNNTSVKYHEKLGFKKEGRLKKQIYRRNRYIDVVLMGLFKEDWIERRKIILEKVGVD